LVFWHIFMGAFALLLFVPRLNNHIDPYVYFNGEKLLIPLSEQIEWYLFTGYLLLVIVISIVSGLCLLVKKNWGRVLSIALGVILIPFGIYLFHYNFFNTATQNPTLVERIEEYWITMGASLNYIELVALSYGIFVIVYFTRKNVITFTKTATNTKLKSKIELH
jgi:hypothetical protein